MGNICSTRDESDLREKDKSGSNAYSEVSMAATKSSKNVFKANPKGMSLHYIRMMFENYRP